MNGEEGEMETRLREEGLSTRGDDRDREVAGVGVEDLSAVNGEEEEFPWGESGANGEASSLSSEEEEGEGEGGDGYILLPQDPDVANGDDIDEDGAVVGGASWTTDSREGEESERQGADSLAAVEGSPRLARWLERQVRDLSLTESRESISGGGGDGVAIQEDVGGWANFSETVATSGNDDWPHHSPGTEGSPTAAGSVQSASTMENGLFLFITVTNVSFLPPPLSQPLSLSLL